MLSNWTVIEVKLVEVASAPTSFASPMVTNSPVIANDQNLPLLIRALNT